VYDVLEIKNALGKPVSHVKHTQFAVLLWSVRFGVVETCLKAYCLSVDVSRSHTDRRARAVGLLWASDQLVAEAAACATQSKHERWTSMPPVGFELTIPVIERPQTYAVDLTATGIGLLLLSVCKLTEHCEQPVCRYRDGTCSISSLSPVTKFTITGFTTQSPRYHRYDSCCREVTV
jgi:hypothetical protein